MQRQRARIPGAKRRWLIFSLITVLVMGCSGWQASPYSQGWDSLKVRPASGDTARILRNVSYFNLMGRPELALKELEEAHQMDPENLTVSNSLAESYEHLGRMERAQQIYLEALAQAPDNAALHNNLCFSYYLAAKLPEAEACFRKTLAQQPNNANARNNLGLVLCRLGRQEEARQLWQEAEGGAAADQKVSQALASLNPAGPGLAPESAAAVRPPAPVPGPQASAPAAEAGASPGARKPGPIQAAINPPWQLSEDAPAAGASMASKTAPGETPPAAAPAAPRQLAAAASPVAAETAPPRTPEAASQDPAPLKGAASHPAPAPAPVPQTGISEARPKSPAPDLKEPQPEPRRTPDKAAAVAKTRPETALTGHPLTCKELVETGIEVLNGNGLPDLARETRTRLHLEGFNVGEIANHLDFRVDRTVIYHRPGAERVARTLSAKFFPGAELETGEKLAEGVDVKILLGHDLPRQQVDAGSRQKDKSL